MDSLKKELVYLSAQQHVDRHDLPPANFLALSGGGDDGAFGAGLLCGWTQSGTRPEFKLVTGISTGALLALLRFSVRNTMMR
jgi:predicted acylesterase/phospholipase RssA